MNTGHWKARAADEGISWEVVREAYAEMREAEIMQVQRTWETREIAWKSLPCGHGGKLKWKYRRAFEGGDMTMIPGFDDVAKELAATEIPELGQDNPAEALWDLIVPAKPQLPAADDTMADAFELALERVSQDLEAVPF